LTLQHNHSGARRHNLRGRSRFRCPHGYTDWCPQTARPPSLLRRDLLCDRCCLALLTVQSLWPGLVGDAHLLKHLVKPTSTGNQGLALLILRATQFPHQVIRGPFGLFARLLLILILRHLCQRNLRNRHASQQVREVLPRDGPGVHFRVQGFIPKQQYPSTRSRRSGPRIASGSSSCLRHWPAPRNLDGL
jgi:hypothetical protein